MARPASADRVTFIVLRTMRTPILIVVGVYAASMVGWVMIPAIDAEGQPRHMSFFHAFYFLTYTATTTGFGKYRTRVRISCIFLTIISSWSHCPLCAFITTRNRLAPALK